MGSLGGWMNFTPMEIYLDFRTAPIGALGVSGALYESSIALGTATGIVNVGGFIAALISIFLIGLILDVLYATGFSQGTLYGLEPFRLALSIQFLVLGAGAAAMLAARRKVRRQMAAQGIVVPPLRAALARQRRENLARRREPAPTDD